MTDKTIQKEGNKIMINVNELRQEVINLDGEILRLESIKIRLQKIISDEENNICLNFIPIIDKHLNKELNKEDQNKLWNELKRHKIKDVISHLEGYKMEYKKSDNAEWLNLIITKKENEIK
jgi:hypothetical protein